MNDYDKTGRYLVKRAPWEFFRWLLANQALVFHAWIDARRVALPNQNDLTNDLVALLQNGDTIEAICLELEAEARADAVKRLLAYIARLWTEPDGRGSVPISCVSGIILDLTGRSPNHELSLRSTVAPGCRLEFTVMRQSLAGENAAGLIVDVFGGKVSPWLLGWAPLMHGGGESRIIAEWRIAAERRMSAERDRAELGSLALVFSTLADCRPAWIHGLKGWNMKTSPFLDEVRAEGREEGREEGRMEGARTLVLRQGRQKFGKPPTKKQQKLLEGITDLTHLEALGERLLEVNSWAELLDAV